ncbi:MAG: hypothetical protein LUP99_04600 [Methanomicrobiales archaeon]|nr:hypothetical protein [Methanomicrobiales archaeon]
MGAPGKAYTDTAATRNWSPNLKQGGSKCDEKEGPEYNPYIPLPQPPYKSLSFSRTVRISVVHRMKEGDLEILIKSISVRDLKEEAKKRGIALGRCPTKMDIARKLPEEALKKLVK